MAEYKYPLSNEWKEARERLSQLEAVWNPWTIRNFGKVGVREGWHCLELAGGGGSIAEWLCRQVGSSGHVVAQARNIVLQCDQLSAIHEVGYRSASSGCN